MTNKNKVHDNISEGVKIIREANKKLENEMSLSEFKIIKLLVNVEQDLKDVLNHGGKHE